MTRPGKIPSQAGFKPRIFRSRGGRLNLLASDAVFQDHTAHFTGMRKRLGKVPDIACSTLPWPRDPNINGQNLTSKKKVRNSTPIIATWNFRMLLDRDELDRLQRLTALIASEVRRYNVDISALSENRLPGGSELCERGTGYIFCWSGHGPEERR